MEAKELVWEQGATEKLFYQDSYLKRFTANVLSCEEYQEICSSQNKEEVTDNE